MTGDNVVYNNGRRRCRACWTETRRNLRRLEAARKDEPITVGSTLSSMLAALKKVESRMTALQALRDKASKQVEFSRRRLEQSTKKERQLQEQFEAQARLHKEVSDLYKAKADQEGAF